MAGIRSLVAVSVSVALLALVAGCSKSEQKAEAPAAATGTAPAPASAPAAAAAPPVGAIAIDAKDAAGNALTGDLTRGARIFNQCKTCHVIDPGVNKVGPSLHGIIGRHSGTAPGFRYSDANKNSEIVWTEQQLYDYLENPRKKIPGTLMTFVGLRDSQQRADVIAYLQENTK